MLGSRGRVGYSLAIIRLADAPEGSVSGRYGFREKASRLREHQLQFHHALVFNGEHDDRRGRRDAVVGEGDVE